MNLTLRTEFSLSSIVHLWLHLSFAKQNQFLFVCAFPQIMNYSSANETCYLYTTAIRKTCRGTHKKSRNLKNEPPFGLLFHYVVRIAHAIFHSTRNFVSMGRYPPLFIPLKRNICSFLVFIRFAIFLKAPACESLLILFWKTTRKKTNSTGQIDAVNFFSATSQRYNSYVNQPTNYICVLRTLAHCAAVTTAMIRFIDFFAPKFTCCTIFM